MSIEKFTSVKVRNSNFIYWAFLVITCIIAYWPLSFHVFSLKNDALNYFLPVRYQISDAISSGYWPLWSPYFNLGYPLHGDMQSGVWNPIVQLFSLFGPYTLRTLELETILYVCISGISMFELIDYFKVDKRISLLIAISFMLCGFNSDSAQFLNWISAASFLPIVSLFYLRTLAESSWRLSILFGFFVYIFFSTSYPADFILLLYLLFTMFLWHLFQKKLYKNFKDISKLVQLHLPAITCFFLLAAPAIISYAQSLPLTERGTGASYADAMSNPINPLLLFSYLTPLGVWKAPFAGITDPLERNSYFGIIPFTLLLCSFLCLSSNKLIRFCTWAFFISLIFSLGEIGLLRPLSYYLLPLMNTFRHPANAKIFTIFFGCLISAQALHEYSSTDSFNKRRIAWLLACSLLMMIAIWAFIGKPSLLFHALITSFKSGSNLRLQLKNTLSALNFSDLLLINVLIQLPFLAVVYNFFVKRVNLSVLLLTGVINCIIHTMLFMPFTVVKKDSATSIQHVLDSIQVKGYPAPDYKRSLQENSQNAERLFAEIGTINMYNKKIGRTEYRITPSNLNIQNKFWHTKPIRNLLFNYPLLYRADTAIYFTEHPLVASSLNKKLIWLSDTSLLQYVNTTRQVGYTVKSESFSPNSLEVEIESQQPGFYCLFQNRYPNWHLYIDGEETKIQNCNIAFMGFKLNSGKHIIRFDYEAPLIKVFFFISLILTLIITFMGIKWKLINNL